jgi:hypothetical protein
MAFSIDDKKNQAPLAGAYAPSQSFVEGPGWNPFDDPYAEEGTGAGKRGGGFSFSTGPAGRMTNEDKVRAYGYEGNLSQMQNNIPPSLRGIESAPNAGVMLEAARVNVKNGIYPNMQAAMDAQIAFNKKYPGYGIEKNIELTKASHDMLLSQDQRPKVTKKTDRGIYTPSAGTGASGPPGRDYKILAPLASRSSSGSSSLGAAVAKRKVSPSSMTGGRRARGYSRSPSYSSSAAKARNNFRGL